MNNFERLEVTDLIGNEPIKQRIFQKLFLGNVILDKEFFDIKKIADTDISFLNVKQLEPNIRAVILFGFLFKFTPDNPLYNYLDTGRAIYFEHNKCFIFNDLDIIQDDLIIINEWYNSHRELNFKKLYSITNIRQRYTGSDDIDIYLLFKEDIERIKTEVYRENELKKHQDLEEQKEKQQREILSKAEERKRKEQIDNFMTLDKIEDTDTIIENNYFIEKEKQLKVVFNKSIKTIFKKDDIISEYHSSYNNDNNFIDLNYRKFLNDLSEFYRMGKYEEPLEQKREKLLNSHKRYWLHFKVYNVNLDTKTEEFLAEIKIENKISKGKLKFFINDILIPKQKMNFALRFIAGQSLNYGAIEADILKERLKNINNLLEQIKRYSGTQLELLNGKSWEVSYNNLKIPLHFSISNPDFTKDNWQVTFNGYTVTKSYNEIKQALWYSNYSDIVGSITNLSEFLGNKIEDKIIDYAMIFIEKRKQAEQKTKQLFVEFVAKHQSQVIAKDNFWIIKGKLKNYKLFFKNDNEVGIETYPQGNYVCINEKNKSGKELVIWDKAIQYALSVINDYAMREEISTIN